MLAQSRVVLAQPAIVLAVDPLPSANRRSSSRSRASSGRALGAAAKMNSRMLAVELLNRVEHRHSPHAGGAIDENQGTDAVRSRLPPGEVLRDPSGIERLSLVGVRVWGNSTHHAEKSGTFVVRKTEELTGSPRPIAAPEGRCKRGEEPMEFDMTPESYFTPLNQKRSPGARKDSQSTPQGDAPCLGLRKRGSTGQDAVAYALPANLQWQLSPTQQTQIANGESSAKIRAAGPAIGLCKVTGRVR
ncbi:hypothetical protein BVG81_004955 [Haliangium sp. UPWRP_2]|nr:hypothetical protein BVG81_004955 [Haliangium sp. UPWRP_2]